MREELIALWDEFCAALEAEDRNWGEYKSPTDFFYWLVTNKLP